MSLASESSIRVPPGTDSYQEAWRAYALRRMAALVLVFGWLPACCGLFLLSMFWLHQPQLTLLVMAAWLGLAVAAVWSAGEFRCPRCRRRYGALGNKKTIDPLRGLFDKTCSNCKLTKFGA